MKKSLSSIFFFSLLCLVFPKTTFASILYLSPGSGSIYQGATSYIQVRIDTQGDSVNAVSAYLSYPQDKVDVTSLSFGSSFSIGAEGSYGGGMVKIARGNVTGVSGKILVATIGFKGKILGSKPTISFIGGSAAPRASDSQDSLNLGGSPGGTYTVVVAPTPIPKDTTGPVISNVTISDIATNSATITWKTDKDSDSGVEYGLDTDKYVFIASDPILTTDHAITITGAFLIPGTNYHLRVVSKDKDGNISTGNDTALQLKGYTITITLLDTKNNPLKNIPLTLYSKPLDATTDQQGQATFTNLPSGKHVLVAHFGTYEKTSEIQVEDSNAPQKTTIHLDVQSNSILEGQTVYYIIGAAILLIILILVIVFMRRRKPNQPQASLPQQETQIPTPTILTV